ncbi:hypothetical protein D3C80_1792730 [compost metagenome]
MVAAGAVGLKATAFGLNLKTGALGFNLVSFFAVVSAGLVIVTGFFSPSFGLGCSTNFVLS